MKRLVSVTVAFIAVGASCVHARSAVSVRGSISAILLSPTSQEGRLVFLRTNGQVVGTIRLPGSRPTRTVAAAALSPDGQSVAYVLRSFRRRSNGDDLEMTDIWIARTDGTGARRLTRTADVVGPVWAPTRGTIAFTRHTDTIVDRAKGSVLAVTSLWSVKVVGDPAVQLLTKAPQSTSDVASAWAPHGTSLTVARCAPATFGEAPADARVTGGFVETSCEIVSVAVDGSNESVLVSAGAEPAWSPDGKSLAFTTARDRNGTYRAGEDERAWARDVYVKDIATGVERRVTASRGVSESAPRWSPDGEQLLFIRDDLGRIVRMNADGTCRRQVSGDRTSRYSDAQWLPTARPGHLRCT